MVNALWLRVSGVRSRGSNSGFSMLDFGCSGVFFYHRLGDM